MNSVRSVIMGASSMLMVCSAAAQSPHGDFNGVYRGFFVCQKFQQATDILRVPLDFIVDGSAVRFARPLFNANGKRVLGSEMASGTVDADGKFHVTSSWNVRGIAAKGDYSGTLTSTGGTLTGTQSWSGPGGSATRTCTGALVSTKPVLLPPG
jgi:hypothetical protein